MLLESWKEFETNHGNQETLSTVEAKMPKVVKKRRKLEETEGQTGVAWEEYFDYIFPDDQTQQPNFKLLAMAHAWRQQVCIPFSTRSNYMVLNSFFIYYSNNSNSKIKRFKSSNKHKFLLNDISDFLYFEISDFGTHRYWSCIRSNLRINT